jgi:hypothetical protein
MKEKLRQMELIIVGIALITIISFVFFVIFASR